MKYENEFYVTGAKVGKMAPKFEMEAVLPEGEMLDRFGTVNLDDLLAEKKWVVLLFVQQRFNVLTS